MKSPFLLHMLGIPGAGKTTFLNILQGLWTKDNPPSLLGFDQIMQAMPEYQAIEDKIEAFRLFELPARKRGYEELKTLINQRKSILFDNGGSAAAHIDLLEDARENGYRIILVSIVTPVDVAKHHVDARSIAEGRHTPMDYLEERERKLKELKESYRTLTPHFYEIENNGLDFTPFQNSCYNVAKTIISLVGEQT